MNGKPQEIQTDEQGNLLEQIIIQGLDQMTAPERAQAGPDASGSETPSAPKQEDGEKPAPPAEKKNRRSSVYLYLLVLFGAAFLMLLLAYFVQQRNNENAMERFRSIDELLEENRALREENAALDEQLDRLNNNLSKLQERYEEKNQEAIDLWNQNHDAQEDLFSWQSFWTLEQYYQAEDYESCAVVLLLQAQGQFTYHTPVSAQERYEKIVQAVIDAGILDEEYYLHPEVYTKLLDEHSVYVPTDRESITDAYSIN